MNFKKGDIVTVNPNSIKDNKVSKLRTAIIISNDDENDILDTVILMPLSTDLLNDMQPYRMRITQRGNLAQDSDVLINQVSTLSKLRIKEKIASITDDEYINIIKYLCKNFSQGL